jgi:hypothetical protein
MKKILYLVFAFIGIQANAQFSIESYGWKFKSIKNSMYDSETKGKIYRDGNIEFYFFKEQGKLQVVYADGSKDNYIVTLKESTGYTENGTPYSVYKLEDLSDHKIVRLQTFKNTESIRLAYLWGYREFY